jgi:hypothetical protein
MHARQRSWAMVRRSVALIAFSLVLGWSVRADADEFTFIASDGASGTVSVGLVEATPNGDGSYTATGGVLIVFGGLLEGTYDLFPNPDPPGFFTSPTGFFIVDDQLFPGQSPTLDGYGLLFTGNGLEINIWGNGADVPYSYWAANGITNILTSNAAKFALFPLYPPG